MGLRIDMGAHEFHNPTIVLTNPTEGEVWAQESTRMISWTSLAVNGPVSISLSTNGDQDWHLLAESVPNIGSFAWVVPDGTEFDQCRIRVLPSQDEAHAVVIDSGQFAIRSMLSGPPTDSPWPSQGGSFQHSGLSRFAGPQLDRVVWGFECDGGIVNSATVGFEGRLHVACEDGRLYTLDNNCTLLWGYDTGTPLLSAPSGGDDGTLYVGSRSGRLYALDLKGTLRWTHDTQGFIYSSPAVSKAGHVYVGSQDGTLSALHRDGTERWRFTIPGPESLGSSILTSPALGSGGTIYTGGLYNSKLYALNPDGTVKWTCDFNPASDDGTVYLIAPNGSELARFTTGGWPAFPVLTADKRLIVTDSEDYAGFMTGNKNTVWAISSESP
jgi:outer membrane protein assembly factor BamB